MAAIDPQKVSELKAFIAMIEQKPQLIHLPQLSFFKSYLQKMGAVIPAEESKDAAAGGGGSPKASSPKNEPEEPELESEEEEDVADYVSDGEEDPDRLKPEEDALPDAVPNEEKELTDEEMDKQGALKGEAQEAVEDGDLKKALEKFTEAMMIGDCSAMMFSKRADMLLKSKRPLAAIKDCDAALELNPDSAKAFKIRGLAYRKLGKWDEAHKDLETAQKLDFDDAIEDARKFVEGKWKKKEQIRVAQRIQNEKREQKRKEKLIKKRKAEIKKAQEAQKKREAEEKAAGGGMPGGFPGGFPGMGGMGGMPGGMGGMPGGMGGMPGGMGGMPGMDKLLQDPELLAALSNPKVMTALQELMSNPASFAKYQNDPEVMSVMEKVMKKMGPSMGGMPGMPGGMGGMPGMPGGMGGMPGGMPGASSAGAQDFSNVEECD